MENEANNETEPKEEQQNEEVQPEQQPPESGTGESPAVEPVTEKVDEEKVVVEESVKQPTVERDEVPEVRFQMDEEMVEREEAVIDTDEQEEYDDKESVEIDESKMKVALGSVISLRKTGVEGGYYDRRVARFGNSYKLYADKPFHVEKVEKLLQEVLLEAMENMQYDPDNCPKQAKWACSMIRAKVKEMEFDRYKIITIVSFGEKRSQDFLYGVRFLWDAERDRFAMSTHDNMFVFGVAMCIGIYYE